MNVATRTERSTIITQYCNAMATYYGAGGHTKAANNKTAAERLFERATAKGIRLPDQVEAAKRGIFNGPGAV